MAKKLIKTTKTRARSKAKPPAKSETKQSVVLAMLRRQNGVSIAEVVEATGWLPASVRGFFSGALKRRLEIDVVSETIDGERRYFVAALKP